MQRNAFGRGRIRFGTDSSGKPLAYRPNQLLIKVPTTTADAVSAVNNAATDAFTALSVGTFEEHTRQPNCSVVGRLDDGWSILEWEIPFQTPRSRQSSTAFSPAQNLEAPASSDRPPNVAYFDSFELAAQLRKQEKDWVVQLNHVYSVDSLSAAPNYVAPNYVAPNYVAPNYVAPITGPIAGHSNSCACSVCPEAPNSDRIVPLITARKAWGPSPGPKPLTIKKNTVEIHVLDVRPQTEPPKDLAESGSVYGSSPDDDQARVDYEDRRTRYVAQQRRELNDNAFNAKRGLTPEIRQDAAKAIRDEPTALLPEALFVLDPTTADEQAAVEDYLVEPTSPGLGANVDADGFVDPATNHMEFIQGVIDYLVLDSTQTSIVVKHSIVGTLGDIDDSHLVKAIDHIRQSPRKTRAKFWIMNLSLSGYNEDDKPGPALASAIKRLQDDGWLVVASAGNNGSCRLAYPAALPNVVSVAAYGSCGPASFSNYGPWVDACAPGVDIVSNFPDIVAPALTATGDIEATEFDTGYASWSGTSFSAPFVAAKIARWIGKNQSGEMPDVAFKAALDELILHVNAPRIPNYGTIVGLENTRVSVKREPDDPSSKRV